MLGTPEVAVVKYAKKNCESKGVSMVHFPNFFGADSGIDDYGNYNEKNVYESLRRVYEAAKKSVEKNSNVDPVDVEHKAFLLASDWIVEAMQYNNPSRTPDSTCAATLDEAVAWVRLGSEEVKARLRGMRQGIIGINLSNIQRFIGKSAENKYSEERNRLHGRIKYLKESSGDKKENDFIQKENSFGVQSEGLEYESAKADLEKRINREKESIQQAELTVVERQQQVVEVEQKYDQQLSALESKHQKRIVYLKNRNKEQLLADLKERQQRIEKKYEKHASLAQKAIFLFHKYKEVYGENVYPAIDWINTASVSLINWCYSALHRGVDNDTVFSYAHAVSIFGNLEITRDVVEKVKKIPLKKYDNLRKIAHVNRDLGVEATIEEVCSLVSYIPEHYRNLLKKGYSKSALIKRPWLNDANIVSMSDDFPWQEETRGKQMQENKGKQQAWCVRHAFYAPSGWQHQRLGGIILGRLDAGIDENIHDASYWLKDFEVPNAKNGRVYKDQTSEMELIYSLTDVPEKLRSRVPTNPKRYTDLFSDEASELVYRALLPLLSQGKMSIADINVAVKQELEVYNDDTTTAQHLKTPLPELAKRVELCLTILRDKLNRGVTREPIPVLVGTLKEIGEQRTHFIDDAQTWVAKHSTTPRNLLTFTWANRDLALTEGCADNPRAIKQWADLNSLRAAYTDMKSIGDVPENFKDEDIKKYENWLKELVRCYDGATAIKAVAELKSKFNSSFYFPPMKIDLGQGWGGEVLPKNDPRGMTIGYDTGCCMTIGGASASCIGAGYNKPSYGFFALYREDRLIAQSFLYANEFTHPNVLVADNIEVNKGRDFGEVLGKYRKFFEQYLPVQIRRGDNERLKLSEVHIGTGYTELDMSSLKAAESVHMPDANIYTDALTQKKLLELPPETVEKNLNIKAEIFSGQDWEKTREQIMEIEGRAFKGGGYGESHLQAEFENPNNIVVVIKDGEKIIGYCSAFPDHNDKEGLTLYVSSTALLPEYQGKGLVSDILYRLDREAEKRGYKYLTRDAAMEHGYADKLKKNYKVVVEGEPKMSPYGLQKYLKVEVPTYSMPGTFEKTKIVEQKNSSIEFIPLDPRQIDVVSSIEGAIYSEELCQGEEFFKEELNSDNDEQKSNASFLLVTPEEKSPVGYVVAHYDDETKNEKQSKEKLNIADVAILQEYQHFGYPKIWNKIIELAKSKNNVPINLRIKQADVYKAFLRYKDHLEQLGYKIVSDELKLEDEDEEGGGGEEFDDGADNEPDEDVGFFGEGEGDFQATENVHIIRLEYLPQKVAHQAIA